MRPVYLRVEIARVYDARPVGPVAPKVDAGVEAASSIQAGERGTVGYSPEEWRLVRSWKACGQVARGAGVCRSVGVRALVGGSTL